MALRIDSGGTMKQGNQYVPKTEYFLYNYKSIKAGVYNKLSELEMIKDSVILSCQETYDRMEDAATLGTSVFSGKTSDPAYTMFNRLINDNEIKDLEKEIRKDRNTIERIDRALDAMSELERNIIRLRYFEGKQWKEVTGEVNLEERQCRTWKNRALSKVAIGLFGTKAMKDCRNTADIF